MAETKAQYETRKADMHAKRKARMKSSEFKVGQKALNHALRNQGVDGFMKSQEAKKAKEDAQAMASAEREMVSNALSGIDMPPVVSHSIGRTTQTIYRHGEKIETVFMDGEIISQTKTPIE